MPKTILEGKLGKEKSTETKEKKEILLGPENRTFFPVEVKGM